MTLIEYIFFFLGDDEQHDDIAVVDVDAVQVLVKELNGEIRVRSVHNIHKGKLRDLDRDETSKRRSLCREGVEQGIGIGVFVVQERTRQNQGIDGRDLRREITQFTKVGRLNHRRVSSRVKPNHFPKIVVRWNGDLGCGGHEGEGKTCWI